MTFPDNGNSPMIFRANEFANGRNLVCYLPQSEPTNTISTLFCKRHNMIASKSLDRAQEFVISNFKEEE
jgi:hypothetical protein